MIRIHNFERGARGLRAIWPCEEMDLGYELVFVAFPPGDAYRSLHPLGSVPFLEDGGVAISESIAIMRYLAQRYGPTPLLPANHERALASVLQMTLFGETAFGMSLNPLLEATYVAPEADKRNWSVIAQEKRVERAVRFVDEKLDGQPFLAGERFTVADISVACALALWRGPLGKTLPENLAACRDRLLARPAFVRALARASAPAT
jgi:glutathione S-transferase